VNFEDRSAVIFPIIYGVDVCDWFHWETDANPTQGKVVWEGNNELSKSVGAEQIQLYLTSWDNPWPNKKVTYIDYYSNKSETIAAPFCVAITIEGKTAP